jgi:hypothetical protein
MNYTSEGTRQAKIVSPMQYEENKKKYQIIQPANHNNKKISKVDAGI